MALPFQLTGPEVAEVAALIDEVDRRGGTGVLTRVRWTFLGEVEVCCQVNLKPF